MINFMQKYSMPLVEFASANAPMTSNHAAYSIIGAAYTYTTVDSFSTLMNSSTLYTSAINTLFKQRFNIDRNSPVNVTADIFSMLSMLHPSTSSDAQRHWIARQLTNVFAQFPDFVLPMPFVDNMELNTAQMLCITYANATVYSDWCNLRKLPVPIRQLSNPHRLKRLRRSVARETQDNPPHNAFTPLYMELNKLQQFSMETARIYVANAPTMFAFRFKPDHYDYLGDDYVEPTKSSTEVL